MNDVLARVMIVIDRHYNGSRPDFARAVGKSSQTLNGFFRQDSKPGADFLAQILQLGFSADWLLSGEGSMYAENAAGRALQEKANAYNPERDDNIGEVLDGRLLMQTRVYTNAITDDDVKNLESLTQKLRSLI